MEKQVEFLDKYEVHCQVAHLLYVLVEFLEKNKDYEVACLILVTLLCHPFRPEKRGKWWFRLVLDLKHLKLKV